MGHYQVPEHPLDIAEALEKRRRMVPGIDDLMGAAATVIREQFVEIQRLWALLPKQEEAVQEKAAGKHQAGSGV